MLLISLNVDIVAPRGIVSATSKAEYKDETSSSIGATNAEAFGGGIEPFPS
jgi:hypothetical protein